MEGSRNYTKVWGEKLLHHTAYCADAMEKCMMHIFSAPRKGPFLSDPRTSTLGAGVRGLRAGAARGAAQPRLICDTGYSDGLQPPRNSQQFPPSVDTGFQRWLFLLPTSIFIQLFQNRGRKCSGLDAEWARAAPVLSKSKGDAAVLTHTA